MKRGGALARAGLLSGGLLGLLVTPSFALSFYPAYGAAFGERPRGWLKALGEPLTDLGLLGGDPVATYTRHGKVFGIALLAVVVSMVVLLRSTRSGMGSQERRGWYVTLGGLGLATLGTFGDYALNQDSWLANTGFGFELLGFLVAMVGTVTLAIALRRETGLSRSAAIAVGALGPVGVIGGAAIVAHLPSGPALSFLVTAVALGVAGLPVVDPVD